MTNSISATIAAKKERKSKALADPALIYRYNYQKADKTVQQEKNLKSVQYYLDNYKKMFNAYFAMMYLNEKTHPSLRAKSMKNLEGKIFYFDFAAKDNLSVSSYEDLMKRKSLIKRMAELNIKNKYLEYYGVLPNSNEGR